MKKGVINMFIGYADRTFKSAFRAVCGFIILYSAYSAVGYFFAIRNTPLGEVMQNNIFQFIEILLASYLIGKTLINYIRSFRGKKQ